jgi:hypothetical protein
MGLSFLSGETGIAGGIGHVNYTPIGTIGTTTVKASSGIFAGLSVTGTGTSWVATVLDGTSTLATGTLTAVGQVLSATPAGLAVRCNTSILVVTTGTAGSGIVLWD